ncbi:hypothetical protein G3I51_05975 [Streptomyces sp. SID9944]|nr:hypothetical protein [Streptomyces sp. SID9944]
MVDTQAAGSQEMSRETGEVALGERTARVPAEGLFDRHRTQAGLGEVAQDPRVAGVESFRGTRMFPRDVELTLGEGRLSDDIRPLRPTRNLRPDVMTSGQLALHMPTVISIG